MSATVFWIVMGLAAVVFTVMWRADRRDRRRKAAARDPFTVPRTTRNETCPCAGCSAGMDRLIAGIQAEAATAPFAAAPFSDPDFDRWAAEFNGRPR